MSFEYLVVLFPRSRRVKINDEFMGSTNKLIEIEGGKYKVTLGPPSNFTPKEKPIELRNTSRMTPMTIEFKEI
jgi:hypothetical protein